MRHKLHALLAVPLMVFWGLTVHPASAALPNIDDLDAVFLRNVQDGFVDYDGVRADPAFRRFIDGISNARESDLEEPGARLAFLINAYNALAIQGVLDGYSPASRSGRRKFFKRREYTLMGNSLTLEKLEQAHIRPLGEPRAHFAISCAAISCPRLARSAFEPETLDAQLDAVTRAFANDPTRNRFDVERRVAFLSSLFEQHAADFARAAGSTQRFLARYVDQPAVAELLARDGFEVRFVERDWDLNGVYRGRPE